MTITPDAAAVLAQIAPVFLIVLLFEFRTSARNTAAAPVAWALIMNVIRTVAAFAVLLIFALSLLVVWSGEPGSAWLSIFIAALTVILIFALGYAVMFSYQLTRARIIHEAKDDHADHE